MDAVYHFPPSSHGAILGRVKVVPGVVQEPAGGKLSLSGGMVATVLECLPSIGLKLARAIEEVMVVTDLRHAAFYKGAIVLHESARGATPLPATIGSEIAIGKGHGRRGRSDLGNQGGLVF